MVSCLSCGFLGCIRFGCCFFLHVCKVFLSEHLRLRHRLLGVDWHFCQGMILHCFRWSFPFTIPRLGRLFCPSIAGIWGGFCLWFECRVWCFHFGMCFSTGFCNVPFWSSVIGVGVFAFKAEVETTVWYRGEVIESKALIMIWLIGWIVFYVSFWRSRYLDWTWSVVFQVVIMFLLFFGCSLKRKRKFRQHVYVMALGFIRI